MASKPRPASSQSPSGSAKRELEIADRVLAERRELAIAAAHIAPPPYVKRELGERPSDPTNRKAWDRGVEEIETYRQRHGVNDPQRALGRERDCERQRETRRQIQEAQPTLGLGQHASRERDLGRSLGIGREMPPPDLPPIEARLRRAVWRVGRALAQRVWSGLLCDAIRVGPLDAPARLTGRNPVDGEPLLLIRAVPSSGYVGDFDLAF